MIDMMSPMKSVNGEGVFFASELVQGCSKVRFSPISAFDQNDPNFDHSEVEKASVKLINGNQTAQSLMDGEHFSKR